MAILYVRLIRGAKGDGNVLIAEQPFGVDRSHGILPDDPVRRLIQLHDDRHLLARLIGEIDGTNRSAVQAADHDIRARLQAGYVGKSRSQFICRSEEVFLASDNEDADRQDGKRAENKGAEARCS